MRKGALNGAEGDADSRYPKSENPDVRNPGVG